MISIIPNLSTFSELSFSFFHFFFPFVFRVLSVSLSFRRWSSNEQKGFRLDMSVEAWLDSLGLGSLAEAFFAKQYTDLLVIQVSKTLAR